MGLCPAPRSRKMKALLVFASFLALVMAQDEPHAECSVVWTVSEDCESVQTRIEDQMFEWYSEENCGEIPPGSSAQWPEMSLQAQLHGRLCDHRIAHHAHKP